MTEEQEKFLQMEVHAFYDTFLRDGKSIPLEYDEIDDTYPQFKVTAQQIQGQMIGLLESVADLTGDHPGLMRDRLVQMREQIVLKMFCSTLMYGLKMGDPTPFTYYLKVGFLDQILRDLAEEAAECEERIKEFLGHAA